MILLTSKRLKMIETTTGCLRNASRYQGCKKGWIFLFRLTEYRFHTMHLLCGADYLIGSF